MKSPEFEQIAARLREAWKRMNTRRFSLHLTIEGWCLVTAMILIGLAALNTGAPLLYLMFSMLCSFFVLSALLATNTIKALRISRDVPRVWVAGEPLRGVLRLRNLKRYTSSYSLRVHDLTPEGELVGAVFFDHAPAGDREVVQEYETLFVQRGVYRLETLEVATRFPFGLIERKLHFQRPAEILVLPQTIGLHHALEAVRSEMGDFELNLTGRGAGLYGLRNYTPELPARDIHWKLSARRGVLIAKEYEAEEKRRACVILDNRVPLADQKAMAEPFEHAIVLAASLVEWLIENDHEVELRTGNGVVGFGAGPTHLTRCRRALASLQMVVPEDADMRHLINPEPEIMRFPVLIQGTEPRRDGTFPVSVESFRGELAKSFQPLPPGEHVHQMAKMF